MTHLLDRVAAFIDGELDQQQRERVMMHLAGCAACRAEVAAHRAVKARLAALPTPEPSADLRVELRRLATTDAPTPTPAPPGRRRDRATRPATARAGGPALPGAGSARRTRPRRTVRVLGSAALLTVTATLVTAFAVGGAPVSQPPTLTPDVDSYLVDHARTSREVPFAELPAGAVDVSFRTGNGR